MIWPAIKEMLSAIGVKEEQDNMFVVILNAYYFKSKPLSII